MRLDCQTTEKGFTQSGIELRSKSFLYFLYYYGDKNCENKSKKLVFFKNYFIILSLTAF